MNIFAFDPDPWQSALWLDDVRKNKMILETAQLLSTAVRFNDPMGGWSVYKPAYTSHPCTRWVRQSRSNFKWLLRYLHALCEQKTGTHKTRSLLPVFDQYADEGRFSKEEFTPFVNCARNKERGVDFHSVEDVHQAYKLYICERWKEKTIPLSWRWGTEPEWRHEKEER